MDIETVFFWILLICFALGHVRLSSLCHFQMLKNGHEQTWIRLTQISHLLLLRHQIFKFFRYFGDFNPLPFLGIFKLFSLICFLQKIINSKRGNKTLQTICIYDVSPCSMRKCLHQGHYFMTITQKFKDSSNRRSSLQPKN